MKSYIVLLLVTILLFSGIASGLPSQKNSTLTILDDDVPIWEVGDSWTYTVKNFGVDFSDTGISVQIQGTIDDFTWTVSSTTGSDYTLDITGKITADYSFYYNTGSREIYVTGAFKPLLTRLEGTLVFTKSNLELKDIDAQIRGITMAVIQPLPFGIPLPYKIDVSGNLDAVFPIVDFPIYNGKTWSSPSLNIQMQATMGGPLGFISFPFTLSSSFPSWVIGCIDYAPITVQGNTYNAYQIEPIFVTLFRLFYSPEVGNLVKLDAALTNGYVHAELVSSTY
jgi:hypothetical protein